MSEQQKKMGKRIFKIMTNTGFLERNPNVGMGDRYSAVNQHRETWVHELTMAIATCQSEEIEREIKKVRK